MTRGMSVKKCVSYVLNGMRRGRIIDCIDNFVFCMSENEVVKDSPSSEMLTVTIVFLKTTKQ